ncbi:MAG: substrate-binding domain-containing protein [Protaetiibacter sp.]
MIVPVIGNPFYAQLVDAVEEELGLAGFELLLADSHGRLEEETRRLRVFGDRRVDGVVVVPAQHDGSADALRTLPDGLAVVQVDRFTDRAIADFVGVDNEVGLRLVLDHLVELGVRSVAFAGSDQVTSSGVERWEMFHRLAEQRDLRTMPGFRRDFSIASGAAAADAFLAAGELPDAIVAGDDLIAVGLIARLRERGVGVPDRLLVTGFDGSELSTVCWPTLTTVVQPVQAIARDAVGVLVDRMRGATGPFRRNLVAPTLRLGVSTTPSR